MRRPSYSAVASTLALLVALGGTGYAAVSLPAASVGSRELKDGAVTHGKLGRGAVDAAAVADRSLSGREIADGSLTGRQIAEATLGVVRRARTAGDAAALGGAPASSYRLACPGGTLRTGDICVEAAARTADTWPAALATCAAAGRRLPSPAELALAFRVLDPQPSYEWTTGYAYYGSSATPFAVILHEDVDGAVSVGGGTTSGLDAYHCVVSPTNV